MNIRLAGADDAAAIGRLLHDFNTEFDFPTPGPEWLARRISKLLADGDTAGLLSGSGPEGFALTRFRPFLYSDGLECYVAELYVVPERRREGIGRALMQAAIDEARSRGADFMDLNTSEDDVAARHLYDSLGFSRREGKENGALCYYYELSL